MAELPTPTISLNYNDTDNYTTKYKFGKRNGACPICGLEDHRCANFGTHIVCWNKRKAHQDITPLTAGWYYYGEADSSTSGNMGGKYKQKGSQESAKPCHSYADFARQSRRRNEDRLIERASAISIEDRNTAYWQILGQLELGEKSVEELLGRGVLESELDFIKYLGFRTWTANKIVKDVTPKVAGLNKEGDRLIGAQEGMGIPAYDVHGRVCGFQMMPHKKGGGPKYYWLSSSKVGGATPHLPNGEMPYFFWQHLDKNIKTTEVWFCEGALKSALTALHLWRMGHTHIAVFGRGAANNIGFENISDAMGVIDPEVVRILPDAGSVNNGMVASSDHKLACYLERIGYPVQFGWWGQEQKTKSPDIDDLLVSGNIPFDRIKPGQRVHLWGNTHSSEVVTYVPKRSDKKGKKYNAAGEPVIYCASRLDGMEQPRSQKVVGAVVSRFDEIKWISVYEYIEKCPVNVREELNPFVAHKVGVSWQDFPAQGFGRDMSTATNKPEFYNKDDRMQVWSNLFKPGEDRKRYVLDSSGVGTGKSYTAGLMSVADWGAQHVSKIIYLHSSPMNCTVDTFQGWAVLRGRDYGRKEDVVVDGQGNRHISVHRAERGFKGPFVVRPNCARTEVAEELAKKRIIVDAKSVCTGCRYAVSCSTGDTGKYSYVFDRTQTLVKDRIVAHHASISDGLLGDLDNGQAQVVLVVDEASQLEWFTNIEVSKEEVSNTTDNMEDMAEKDERARVLRRVVRQLRDLQKNKDLPHYGLDHDEIVQHLNKWMRENGVVLPDFDQDELERMTERDLSFFDDFKETEGLEYEDELERDDYAMRRARTYFSSKEYLVKQVEQKAAMMWLPDFLKALKGDGVRMSMTKTKLTFKARNQALLKVLTHDNVVGTLLLDGTETEQFFADRLGHDVHHIQATQEVAPAEVNVVQIFGAGLVTSNQRDEQVSEVNKIRDAIRERTGRKTPIIRHKVTGDENEGAWFRDSRGSNIYQNEPDLILAGTPCPPIKDMVDEYALIKGYDPVVRGRELERDPRNGIKDGRKLVSFPVYVKDWISGGPYMHSTLLMSADDGVAQYIRERVLSNYHQAIGRLRAARRTGEILTVFVISSYPLDIPVESLWKRELLEGKLPADELVRQAIEDATAAGHEVTAERVQRLTGVSKAYVYKTAAWKDYRKSIGRFDDSPTALNNICAQEIIKPPSNASTPTVTAAQGIGHAPDQSFKAVPIPPAELEGVLLDAEPDEDEPILYHGEQNEAVEPVEEEVKPEEKVEEVPPIMEADGFRVGERVRLSLDHIDDEDYRQYLTKSSGFPEGQEGVVVSLAVNKTSQRLGKRELFATVQLLSSRTNTLANLSELRHTAAPVVSN